MQEKTLIELIDMAKSQLGQANAMIDWSTRAAKDGLLVSVYGIKAALFNAVTLSQRAHEMAVKQYGPIVLDKPVEDEKS